MFHMGRGWALFVYACSTGANCCEHWANGAVGAPTMQHPPVAKLNSSQEIQRDSKIQHSLEPFFSQYIPLDIGIYQKICEFRPSRRSRSRSGGAHSPGVGWNDGEIGPTFLNGMLSWGNLGQWWIYGEKKTGSHFESKDGEVDVNVADFEGFPLSAWSLGWEYNIRTPCPCPCLFFLFCTRLLVDGSL